VNASTVEDTFYCGPAPLPDTLLLAWNFDLVALLLCAGLVAGHARWGNAARRGSLWAAVATLLVLFWSPLCALTVALFSARVAHHVLLIAMAAPLLALAFPLPRNERPTVPLGWLAALHALILWLWHAPAAYGVAIDNGAVYWAMQASLLGSAFLFWRSVLAMHTGVGEASLALLFTVVQMGMLGALLTFAGAPLYEAHLATTLPFGLTPLGDQQLGGLIMWVPAALPYVAAALWRLSAILARSTQAVRR